MSHRVCTGEPISWLRLERYRLGELPASEHDAMRAHLDACVVCTACLSEVDRPLVLPPLDLPVESSLFLRARRALLGLSPAGAFLRVAFLGLVLVLLVHPIGKTAKVSHLPGQAMPGIKGGDVALELVRERSGIIEHDATTFAPEDRWKVLVTCPTDELLFWDVAVVEGAQASFPLAASAPIACGNHVPLPGAFNLTGGRTIHVCLVWASEPIDRRGLASVDPTLLSEQRTCTKLQPAEPAH